MTNPIEPDRQKAKSLRDMAVITLDRLDKTDKEKYPSNTLVDYYEIIHKLLESLACIEGIKVRGEGAHSELIDIICSIFKLESNKREFMQEMRDYRNHISYEGFNIKAEYIKNRSGKIKEIIKELIDLINKKLK